MAFNISLKNGLNDKIKDFLFGDKGAKALICGAIAAMLLILCSSFSCGGENSTEEEKYAACDASEIEQELEERIKELVSQISGAGAASEISVMITVDTTSTAIFEKDIQYENISQNNGVTTSRNAETVLVGSGKEPLQTGVSSPEVRGATVVCKGAADPVVCERITHAVAKALDIGLSRVCVTY